MNTNEHEWGGEVISYVSVFICVFQFLVSWLGRDDDSVGGGASSSVLSGMNDAGIAIDVLLSHAFDGKAFARDRAAGFGIDLVCALNRVGHFFD